MNQALLAPRPELHVVRNHFCECAATVCHRVLCPDCGWYLARHCRSEMRASSIARHAYEEHPCAPTGHAPLSPKWW